MSRVWFHVKNFDNRLPTWGKPLLVALFIPGAEVPYILTNLREGKLPWAHWGNTDQRRGMSRIHDIRLGRWFSI